MVKQYLFLVCASILSSPASYGEGQESFAEFKQEVGDAQQKIDYSKHLLRHDELHKYIPDIREESPQTADAANGDRDAAKSAIESEADKTNQGGNKEKNGEEDQQTESPKPDVSTQVGSSEEDGKSSPTQKDSRESEKPRPSKSKPSRRGVYIAPSLRSMSGGSSVNNVAAISQPESRSIIFGIRIGTEIEVELVGGASNVQNGLMKFRVTRTTVGDKRQLPLNTLLFARPSAVMGSSRLFTSQTMQGITPDGKEFSLKASIRANDRQPGLSAYVVNDGKKMYRAAEEGKAALADNLLSLAPDGVIVDAGKAAAGQALREEQSESRAKYGSGVYVVQANPQPAVIEIEETF